MKSLLFMCLAFVYSIVPGTVQGAIQGEEGQEEAAQPLTKQQDGTPSIKYGDSMFVLGKGFIQIKHESIDENAFKQVTAIDEGIIYRNNVDRVEFVICNDKFKVTLDEAIQERKQGKIDLIIVLGKEPLALSPQFEGDSKKGLFNKLIATGQDQTLGNMPLSTVNTTNIDWLLSNIDAYICVSGEYYDRCYLSAGNNVLPVITVGHKVHEAGSKDINDTFVQSKGTAIINIISCNELILDEHRAKNKCTFLCEIKSKKKKISVPQTKASAKRASSEQVTTTTKSEVEEAPTETEFSVSSVNCSLQDSTNQLVDAFEIDLGFIKRIACNQKLLTIVQEELLKKVINNAVEKIENMCMSFQEDHNAYFDFETATDNFKDSDINENRQPTTPSDKVLLTLAELCSQSVLSGVRFIPILGEWLVTNFEGKIGLSTGVIETSLKKIFFKLKKDLTDEQASDIISDLRGIYNIYIATLKQILEYLNVKDNAIILSKWMPEEEMNKYASGLKKDLDTTESKIFPNVVLASKNFLGCGVDISPNKSIAEKKLFLRKQFYSKYFAWAEEQKKLHTATKRKEQFKYGDSFFTINNMHKTIDIKHKTLVGDVAYNNANTLTDNYFDVGRTRFVICNDNFKTTLDQAIEERKKENGDIDLIIVLGTEPLASSPQFGDVKNGIINRYIETVELQALGNMVLNKNAIGFLISNIDGYICVSGDFYDRCYLGDGKSFTALPVITLGRNLHVAAPKDINLNILLQLPSAVMDINIISCDEFIENRDNEDGASVFFCEINSYHKQIPSSQQGAMVTTMKCSLRKKNTEITYDHIDLDFGFAKKCVLNLESELSKAVIRLLTSYINEFSKTVDGLIETFKEKEWGWCGDGELLSQGNSEIIQYYKAEFDILKWPDVRGLPLISNVVGFTKEGGTTLGLKDKLDAFERDWIEKVMSNLENPDVLKSKLKVLQIAITKAYAEALLKILSLFDMQDKTNLTLDCKKGIIKLNEYADYFKWLKQQLKNINLEKRVERTNEDKFFHSMFFVAPEANPKLIKFLVKRFMFSKYYTDLSPRAAELKAFALYTEMVPTKLNIEIQKIQSNIQKIQSNIQKIQPMAILAKSVLVVVKALTSEQIDNYVDLARFVRLADNQSFLIYNQPALNNLEKRMPYILNNMKNLEFNVLKSDALNLTLKDITEPIFIHNCLRFKTGQGEVNKAALLANVNRVISRTNKIQKQTLVNEVAGLIKNVNL